jgi:SAM-dependent methyltransferase
MGRKPANSEFNYAKVHHAMKESSELPNDGNSPSRNPKWFETAFGADYTERYAHRNDEEANEAVTRLISPLEISRGARVLDLCCGAGRHSLELAKFGFEVVSFDLSASLLRLAGERLKPHAALSSRVRGDMRVLPFAEESFSLIVNFFTSFGYFEKDSENLRVLSEVARVLNTGGWFLFDFLNRERVVQKFGGTSEIREEQRDKLTGEQSLVIRRLSDQGRRVEKDVLRTDIRGSDSRIAESLRLYSPAELRDAISGVGLRVTREAGSYDGRIFDPEASERWIAIARKPE